MSQVWLDEEVEEEPRISREKQSRQVHGAPITVTGTKNKRRIIHKSRRVPGICSGTF